MKFNHLNVPDHWQNYWSRYPEGYTILEALISWVSQVDNMVDNVNDWNTYLAGFVAEFDTDLQDKVTNTLSEWQESGFLNLIINEAIQTQQDAFEQKTKEDFSVVHQALETKLSRNTDELDINMFNEEDRATLQGLAPGTVNAVLGTGNVKTHHLSPTTVTPSRTTFAKLGKNHFNRNTVVPGYLGGAGVVLAGSDTYVSDFIDVQPGEKWFRSEYTNQLAFYKERNVSSFQSILAYGSQTSGLVTIPEGVYAVRVTVNDTQLGTYQFEKGTSGSVYEPYGVALEYPRQKSVDQTQLADLAVSDRTLQNKTARIFFEKPTPFLTVDFQTKTIKSTSIGYLVTLGIRLILPQTIDFSDSGNTTINLLVDSATGVFTTQLYKEPITNLNLYHVATIYISGGVVYATVNTRTINTDGSTLDNFRISNEQTGTGVYSGQKIVFYGDSITNHPTRLQLISNILGFSSHLNLGWSDSAVTMENKLAWVNPTTGVFMGNPASGGEQPAGSVAIQSSFCHDDRITFVPTDADLIFIMGGTNDLFRNKPLGDLTSDNTTFTGALIETIKKIQLKVPNALIVVATPIVAIDGAGSALPKSNSGGFTILDYVKKVEEVVDYTGVAFSDVHQCGINLFNGKDILPDGTHPSTPKGTELLSRKIVGDLKAIAPY